MERCKYFLDLDGVRRTFNSDQELSTFVRHNITSKGNRVKFSKTTVGVEGLQERIAEKVRVGVSPYSELFLSKNDFLKKKHKIDGELKHLSPVFIIANYKELAVESTIKKDEALNELSINNPEEAKRLAEVLVEKELELDQRMLEISSFTTEIMEGMVRKDKNYFLTDELIYTLLGKVARYNLYEELKGSPKNKNEIIEDYIVRNFNDATINNIKEKLLTWYKQIKISNNTFIGGKYLNKAITITDFNNVSDNNEINHPGIKSRASYISVDSEGKADIFEIKVTRNDFKEWHSAKTITTDYTLGINKQIVENITNVNSLYIVPVVFPTKGDKILVDSFYVGNSENRSISETNSGLSEGGDIITNLQQLLPATPQEDIEVSSGLDKLNTEVLGIVFPKYNFRTKVVKKNAEKRYNDHLKEFIGEPKLFFWDEIAGRKVEEPNTTKGKEAFKIKVFEYIEKQNKHANSRMLDLIKKIKDAKRTFSTDSSVQIKAGKKNSIATQRIFRRYLSEEWELIENRPELLNAGIFIFRNNMNRTFEVISMSVNQMEQINDFNLGNTILGQYKKNSDLVNDKKILIASNQNIELMKALIVLNNNPDLMKGYSLNSVNVINSFENKSYPVDLTLGLYNLTELLKVAAKHKQIPNNFKDKKIKVSNAITVLFNEITTNTISVENKVFKAYLNKLEPESLAENREKLDFFINMREKLLKTYPDLAELEPTKIQNFDEPKYRLYFLISSGITHYGKIDSIFDLNVPKFGISGNDWTHWVRNFMFGTAPDYDKDGNKIVGLFQGQMLTTADTQQSQYLARLHDIINIARNSIASEYNKKKNILINATNTYYKSIGRSGIEKMLLGNSDKFHEVFFDQHNGNITKEFKLVNPWVVETLTTAQSDYLKFFIFFQYMNSQNPNLDIDSVEKFEKSKEFKKLTDSGKMSMLLEIPLIVRHSIIGRVKNLTAEGFRESIGQMWDTVRTNVDGRDVTSVESEEERQRVGAYKGINGLGHMYNRYDLQESGEYRSKLIEEYGIGHFERNLDTIGLKYAFERIRENTYKNTMPFLDAAVVTMKFYGYQSGQTEEVEEVLTNFHNDIKIKVHNATIIKNKELLAAAGVVKQVQHVGSIMTIALRPALMMKELLIGLVKNASYSWSKMYGGAFEGKHLLTATKLLVSSSESYEINKQLNNEYQLANRDLNQIVTRTKVDRFGINFFSDLLFWFNTAPDYINRMSLFVAKMLQDGSYNAHILDKQGNLIYNPSKDDRFSYYFKVRDKYKFQQHKTDIKYNDQRSLYLKSIDVFNEESITLKKKTLTEKDNLPRAYTTQERESVKSFIDLSYGHYDKDNSTQGKHTLIGIMFGQYMTFWPSKVKYYLGKPQKNSKQGKMRQKYVIENGKKMYYFVKYETDENGDMYRKEVPESELTSSDPREKAFEWDGDPLEGLLYSLSAVSRSIYQGNLENSTPEQIARAKVALHDLIMAMLSILLGYFLVKNWNKSKNDETALSQYEELALKIVTKASGEFDPFASIFGALQATPAFIDKTGQVVGGIKDLALGNTELALLVRKTFIFTEVFPELEDALTR